MSLQDAFFAAPPIARTLTAVTVLISVPGHMMLYNLYWMVFGNDFIFTIRRLPQIWRVATSFCVTGPDLGLLFDPFFLWTYSSQLEVGTPRFSPPGAFAVYLFFVWAVILLTGGMILGGRVLLNPLTTALAYTIGLEDPNRMVSFFVIQMRAKYVPYAMLVITFVLAGPRQTMLQATGILAGHAYEFFDKIWPEYGGGPRLIQVPMFVQRLFAPAPGGQERTYGRAFTAQPGGPGGQAAPQTQGRGNAFTSGTSWNARGAGRRLGGE